MGKYDYSGSISAKINFEYFPFYVQDESLFVVDIIKEKSLLDEYEYWKIQKELNLLNVNEEILYQSFNSLSKGEQIKVLLASLFLKENSFLLIDEPTNHLDVDAKQSVCNYLKSKNSFILVSHDRNLLDSCVDHILSINKTSIEITKGNFSSWQENKQRQDKFEHSKNNKLKKEISKLKKSATEKSSWSNKAEKAKFSENNSGLKVDRGYVGHKAAKIMKRSKNLENRQKIAIDEKSKLLNDFEENEKLKLNLMKHPNNTLLQFSNSSFYYSGKLICENINLKLNQGDRIAILGKNGCGKSTILKFLNNETDITCKGIFTKARNLKISYIQQDTSKLTGSLSEFTKSKQIDKSLFLAILHKLGFSRIQFEKDITQYSSGQKKKVLLAKSLCEKAHLYIWDESLNFIDILSRIQLEELIKEFKPTMLFVEHDESFVNNIATEIFQI